jgi:hypothetical protein
MGRKIEIDNKVIEHIKEYYSKQELRDQIDYMNYNKRYDIDVLKEMVNGGCFLIYHKDIIPYMNSLELRLRYSFDNTDKAWSDYVNLIASVGTKWLKNKEK